MATQPTDQAFGIAETCVLQAFDRDEPGFARAVATAIVQDPAEILLIVIHSIDTLVAWESAQHRGEDEASTARRLAGTIDTEGRWGIGAEPTLQLLTKIMARDNLSETLRLIGAESVDKAIVPLSCVAADVGRIVAQTARDNRAELRTTDHRDIVLMMLRGARGVFPAD